MKEMITSLAQTADGYLWFGTNLGLVRFDGVRAVRWQPPPNEPHLPSDFITAITGARDSALWIGTNRGLARWRNGRLTTYADVAGENVTSIVVSADGTVWFGLSEPGRLCAIRADKVRCHGAGQFGGVVNSVLEDSTRALWVGASTGLWKWSPGDPVRYALSGDEIGPTVLVQGNAGRIIMATQRGLKRLTGHTVERYALSADGGDSIPWNLIRSSDGSLWVATSDGVLHVHGGKSDRFTATDGLSSRQVLALLEDREGNVWVSTTEGLDRFRVVAVSNISSKQGLSHSIALAVFASYEGGVWIGTPAGLDRWTKPASQRVRRAAEAEPDDPVAQVVATGLRGPIYVLAEDAKGNLLASTDRVVEHLQNGRFIPQRGLPSKNVLAIASANNGSLYVSTADSGLFRWLPNGSLHHIAGGRFMGTKNAVRAILFDSLTRGVWLGLGGGGLAHLVDDQVRVTYTAADGLARGAISDLRLASDGALWVAAEGGLSYVKDRRIATLTQATGLPCDAIHWAIEDDDRSLWVYQPCGLVKIARRELDAWRSDPKHVVNVTIMDSYDGVRSFGFGGSAGGDVTKSTDGRIWFVAGEGVSVIDPKHLPVNTRPPPVQIEQISVNGRTYDGNSATGESVRLPPNVRNLEIQFTALSLTVPEKVRFRFRLEGQDPDWREVVNQRRVEYSNLTPGTHRFRLTAANNSGVWNDSGISVDFIVAPAVYQTLWFRVLGVLLIGAIGAAAATAIQRRRHVREQEALKGQYRATLAERARIAQELHDTLLQGFAGVTLQLKTAELALPEQPDVAAETLLRVQQLARASLREARERVWEMRDSELGDGDLPNALEAIAKDRTAGMGIEVSVNCSGRRRRLERALEDTAFRIGREAIANAVRHAGPHRIDVRVEFDEAVLRLAVRDDGRGFTAEEGVDAHHQGHFGLSGIRERAQRLGGHCDVRSLPGRGTTVTVELPLAEHGSR